jgi:hypothetical protein
MRGRATISTYVRVGLVPLSILLFLSSLTNRIEFKAKSVEIIELTTTLSHYLYEVSLEPGKRRNEKVHKVD